MSTHVRPPTARLRPGWIPLRYETRSGEAKWRAVPNLEHATLCRAFGLDQTTFWFDMPSSFRAAGRLSVGAGSSDVRRRVNGFVMHGRAPEPFGKLSVAWESERFSDRDPNDRRDFYDLNHS